MLIELRIRDYAVIDDLSLGLKPGLNVLSGETGAGKSIIVGALSLLVGERASTQVVRAGADRAVVEAVFDISHLPRIETRLRESGYALQDGLLILRREVALEGRNRAWVNGSPATASALGELGGLLVDIHGQHEHQSLLRSSEQRDILDSFGGAEGVAAQVRQLHGQVATLRKALEQRRARISELEARADFLRFQLKEIEDAKPRAGEEETLEEEARRLEHAQELAAGARELHVGLYEGEDSVSDRLAAFRDLLGRLARKDPALENPNRLLEEAFHLIAEAGQRMASYGDEVEEDPVRLEEIRGRQEVLFKLKRKYGPTLVDVLTAAQRLRVELEEVETAPRDLERVEEELARLNTVFLGKADELSSLRMQAGARLEEAVGAVLPALGLPGAEFRVRLSPLERPDGGGAERVELLASLNPGFEPGALSRVASGGELSRIMLALKAILAESDSIPTLVFDEIDSGIGGEIALKVADKLRHVAQHHQVFVITHLPQLASRAHHQLSVEKGGAGGLASTAVREVSGEDRVTEIARMLGGNPRSARSREHARELLESV